MTAELREGRNPAAAPPVLKGQYSSNGVGKWYAGAMPKNGADRPLLVFVPGLGDSAPTWWRKRNGFGENYGENDMYARAFAAGYRTAFVNFDAPVKKPGTMWRNGKILAWQLKRICAHFGVRSAVLIAHSKGGVDSETAVRRYGADKNVQKIITLSTPHWGSQLADIAYSPAGWALAEQLNFHSDGCYVMQTGYMHEFRRTMMNDPELKTPIITYGGKNGGPPFSITWAGSVLLKRFGPNDGVVTAESAHHPSGEHFGTLNLNHIQIHFGRFAWPYVAAAVGEERPVVQTAARGYEEEPSGEFVVLGQAIAGGKMIAGMKEAFSVPPAAGRMALRLIYTGDASPALISPSGKTVDDFRSAAIQGGRTAEIVLENPEAGEWRLISTGGRGAYFSLARFYAGEKNGIPEQPSTAPVSERLFRIYPDRIQYIDGAQPLSGDKKLQNGLYGIEMGTGGGSCPYCRCGFRQLAVLPPGAGAESISPRRRR